MAKDRTLENINIQGVGKGRRAMKGDSDRRKIQEKPTKAILLDKAQYQMLSAQKGISWL